MAHSTPLNYLWVSVLCYFEWNPDFTAHRMPSKWNINNLWILFSYLFEEVLIFSSLLFVRLFVYVFFLIVMNCNQILITMTKSSLTSFSELFFFFFCYSFLFHSMHLTHILLQAHTRTFVRFLNIKYNFLLSRVVYSVFSFSLSNP